MYHTPALTELRSPSSFSTRMHWRLRVMLEHLDHHDDHLLTLGCFSQKFGISEGQLSRLFLQGTGQRFRNLVMAYRLLHTADLLRSTDKPIKQIAGQLGYEHCRD